MKKTVMGLLAFIFFISIILFIEAAFAAHLSAALPRRWCGSCLGGYGGKPPPQELRKLPQNFRKTSASDFMGKIEPPRLSICFVYRKILKLSRRWRAMFQ